MPATPQDITRCARTFAAAHDRQQTGPLRLARTAVQRMPGCKALARAAQKRANPSYAHQAEELGVAETD